ncbi:MAG: ATP-binding cassette domain-containing protein [bacterium]|nr:ATP-binding cassette domain-containing protein [bacterium]
MHKGEVFCLLGHNGAGKTTTIGMLTGLLDVTSGDAWILGNDIRTNMREARKYLGACPQHDVLWDKVTYREHLMLFARLKGVPREYVGKEADRIIALSQMQEKTNAYPPELSGGQKRKLSLGIALIGGSKVVFLDEPTSGMDPQSRRITWDIIAKEKRDRCIILTTHFMDEADVLGDRIAIMSGGKIKCCGTSLFLKRLYGVGYTFTVSLKAGTTTGDVQEDIDSIVLKRIQKSSVVSVAGGEICYRLPFEETPKFPDLFGALDESKEETGIENYGISVTTLEEVFLKIGHMEGEVENPKEIPNKSIPFVEPKLGDDYDDDEEEAEETSKEERKGILGGKKRVLSTLSHSKQPK